MRKIINVIILIPIFLEFIDSEIFVINLDPLPYSLGRLLFIILGLYSLFKYKFILFNNKVFQSMLIIYFGYIFASVFSTGSDDDLIRSIGLMILLIGSLGFSKYINSNFIMKYIAFFMFLSWIYWALYIINSVISIGLFDYRYYGYGSSDAINHHTVGLSIIISTFFLFIYLFKNKSGFNPIGYIFLTISLLLIFITENRSGLFFSILGILFLFGAGYRKISRNLVFMSFLLTSLFYILYRVSDFSNILYDRFNLTDTQYLVDTNQERIALYTEFFPTFLQNLMGQGPNPAVDIGYNVILMHNQYLTFILGGGIIAVVGVILLIKHLSTIFFHLIFKSSIYNKHSLVITFTSIIYFINLITIEQGGIGFYLMLSFLICSYDLLLKSRIQNF